MINIKAENQQSLKEAQAQTEATARAEAQSENAKVRKHIAAIRGHKAGEFVTEGMKHGRRLIESGVDVITDLKEGNDTTESLEKVGKSAGGLIKEAAGAISDNWEKVKEDFRNGKIHQKARWWMLSREGAAAAFDHRIAEQDQKLGKLNYRKQTEARKFKELQAKFKDGKMSERDIERSMREHVLEFEKEEEKARVEKERVEKEKKEHEQKVQELKNRVNERITKAINDIKLETNYDFNKEKQGNLKEQIEKGEAQLAKNKKEHKDLEARCKLIYGEGWLSASWLRKKLNLTRSESTVLGDFSAKQAEKLTAEQKADFAKAKGDIKRIMETEKMSFENVARETKDCLAEHTVEIARLEKNLAKLRALKDPLDKVVIKAEGRMNKFEGERKSFGIAEKIDGLADEAVGEQVEVKSFANVKESKDYKDKLIGKEVVDLNSKIKSPAAWFGKAGALNFKVSGYENHSNAQRNQEVLLKIREEADSMSFKLEKTATKLRSTLKSKDTKKDNKPEFEKHLKEVTDKIEELKMNILDRIPVDRDGKIDEFVDQEAVLRILCPDIFTTSKNKKEVFGNELKTDEEKAEALKTLQDAIAEIDALPSPLARLKAYTKTISFMLDSKLRVDFADSDAKKDNTKAIDDIYLSIFSEKIPQLFSEISDPHIAIEEGINAIKVLAESGAGPDSSREVMRAITQGISENIRNAQDAKSAYSALMSFTEQYCQLDESILKSASGSIDALLATGLTNSVIRKIKESPHAFDASEKIADLASDLAEKSNGKISPQYIKKFFNIALAHLESQNKVDIDERNSTKDEVDVLTAELPLDPSREEPQIRNMYQESLRYIEDKMNALGVPHGETVDTERTPKQSIEQIEELNKNKDLDGLTELATELALQHHPDEAIEAIDLAKDLCNGDARLLLDVTDRFASVNDEFYRNKAKEMYDGVLESLENKNLISSVEYLRLIDSLVRIDSKEQMSKAAESFASKLVESASVNPRNSINLLNSFMRRTGQFSNESAREELLGVSLKIAESLYGIYSQDKDKKGTVVELLVVMENSQLEDSAFRLFSNQINEQSAEDALEFVQHFKSKVNFPGSPFGIAGEMSEESNSKYIDKIISKVVAESTVIVNANAGEGVDFVETTPIVKNLVNLYKTLNENGFNSKTEGLFENNIDLENQRNLVDLIDVLSKDFSDRNTAGLVEGYAKKAIEHVAGDFDKTLDLMAHWADLDNDLYVSVKAGALKMANQDFDKLIKLADVMNKHDITLGLHATIDEAEMIARESFEKNLKSRGFEVDSTFSELEKVAEMFKSVKNLEGEGKRIEAEINEIKNKESINKTDDLELLNENVFRADDADSLFEESPYSGEGDFSAESIRSSFPGSIDNPDANFAGGSSKKPQKKKGLFASFFSSLFGGGGSQ